MEILQTALMWLGGATALLIVAAVLHRLEISGKPRQRTVLISEELWRAQRMVATRNHRLARLRRLGAPEFVIQNERELLQRAVDAVTDLNAWEGKLEDEEDTNG